MTLWRVLTFIAFSVLMFHIKPAFSQSMASIPLSDSRMPSDDLFYNGRILRADQAFQLSRQGVDLSLLNPIDSAIWSSANDEQSDDLSVTNELEFEYSGALLSASGLFRFNANQGNEAAIVHLDKTLHTILLRKNLLRKLGYKVPAMKWFDKITVRFRSLELMSEVLDSLIPRATLGAASRWVVSKDEDAFVVELRDVLVTVPSSSDHYNVAMGVPPQTLTNRTLRSLIVPYALLDLGESANKFEWSVGRNDNQSILLPHFTRGIFATTLDDAKWITRRLSLLDRSEIADIVRESHFPAEVAALLTEKLISRRNALADLFKVEAEALAINPDVSLGEHLKKGKLEKEDWEGYASRFAHGDPESPFKDIHWFALSKLQSFAFDNLIARANQELMIFNPNDVRSEFHKDQFERGLNHFVETGYFLDFPVASWVSPVADINLIASRDVVVGNYLGTDNLVQLADSVGWSVQLGAHVGIENLEIAPTAALRGTVSISKMWSHLKPLRSLKNVFKEPYQNIVVPLLKHQLAKSLDRLQQLSESENPNVDWNLDEDNSALSEIISHLNSKLGVGESILYTERVTPSATASMSTSLMGTPVHFSLSGGVDMVDIRRIHIYRKDQNTFQVYDDFGHGKGWSLNVSLERFVPIIRIGLRQQKGHYNVKVHELNLNPDVRENPKLFEKANALSQFIQTGSSELLSDLQQPHTIDAEYLDKSTRFAFLFWRHKKLKTDTLFDINANNGLSGKFIALSDDKQTGLNYEAFIKDVINYGFQRLSYDVNWAAPVWQNPAETIGGMATTKGVRFEARVQNEDTYDERFMRLTDRYEGWSKKVKRLKERLRDMNEKFGFNLFDVRTLENVDRLKLFDVAVNLNLYEQGIQKLANIHPNSLIYMEYLYEEERGIRERGCREERIRRRRLSDGRVIESCGTLNTVIWKNRECQDKIKDNKSAKEVTKCLMRLFRDLYEDLEFKEIKMLLGEENVFVHGSINGFRDGDEVLNDTIEGNTSGRVGSRFWNGPFDRIRQLLGIQEGEMNGLWLRERL